MKRGTSSGRYWCVTPAGRRAASTWAELTVPVVTSTCRPRSTRASMSGSRATPSPTLAPWSQASGPGGRGRPACPGAPPRRPGSSLPCAAASAAAAGDAGLGHDGERAIEPVERPIRSRRPGIHPPAAAWPLVLRPGSVEPTTARRRGHGRRRARPRRRAAPPRGRRVGVPVDPDRVAQHHGATAERLAEAGAVPGAEIEPAAGDHGERVDRPAR